jgi:hypothetical protein
MAYGDSTISGIVAGTPLAIRTTAQFAGAIMSLTWNGVEFIDAYDHGRQLQSAAQFNGTGEDYNPTEAGSSADGTGPTSSSYLNGISASGNHLATEINMAFWLPVNGETISNHILNKDVTIGHAVSSHIIKYLVEFHVPIAHTLGLFEYITGYMPDIFSSFWTYNPRTEAISSLSGGPGTSGNNNEPIIFSYGTNYAMGVYSPGFTAADGSGSGYIWFTESFFGAGIVKWSLWHGITSTPIGVYPFEGYVIVGNLADVKTAMTQLHNTFYPLPVENSYKVNGVLLNTILKARISPVIANTGFQVAGVDLAQYYERLALGSAPATTNFKVNGIDFNALFQAK